MSLSNVVMLVVISKVTAVTLNDMIKQMWRPFLSGVVVVQALRPDLNGVLYLAILIDVVIGVVTFMLMQLLLWRMSGCPDGLESLALKMIKKNK